MVIVVENHVIQESMFAGLRAGPESFRSVAGPDGYAPQAGSKVGSVGSRTPPNSSRAVGPPMYVSQRGCDAI